MAANPDPDDLAGIIVPEDASALDADRWRYYQELNSRGELRHSPDQPSSADHLGRWREGLPWFGSLGSYIIPLGFVVAAALAMIGSLMLATVARVDAPVPTAPLANNTTEVGLVGGLMPSATVAVNGAPRLLRDIRPAIVALVPAGPCPECAAGVANAAAIAQTARVRFIVASEGRVPADAETNAAEAYATAVGAASLVAPTGTFADFRPSGLTLFAVAPDGVVSDVARDADATATLEISEPSP